MKNQDYLYLDHAASTPMRKSAMDKYIEAESYGYANSSGGHKLSRNSKNLLEDSREKIAELLNAAQGEIVFTSGGTEADNWTIKSLFNSERPNDNLVTSNIEHEAVIASAEWVSSNGFHTKYAKSDKNGLVTKDEFLGQVDNDTKVASLMWGNNETGIIQPIKDIAREIKTINSSTLFHSDVVQGIISDNIDFHKNGIESAAVSAHKIGGPKGVGAMFININHKLPSFLHGGKQELERRAGTVDVPGIAAFATALEEQQSFKDLHSEVLLIQLDLNGLGVSRGSACASGAQKPSHVLEAMNINPKFINSHLRFSFGWTTQVGDGDKAAEIVMQAVKEIE